MIGERIHGNGFIRTAGRIYVGNTAEQAASEKPSQVTASSAEAQDRLEISEEGRKAAGQMEDSELEAELNEIEDTKPETEEEVKQESDTDSVDSEKQSGKVGFNEGKRARQLAAASTPEQVQMVIEMLNQDLDDCEAGLKQGMCDENEVAKVKAMLQRAHQRVNEVSGQEKEEGQGIDAFAIASLM